MKIGVLGYDDKSVILCELPYQHILALDEIVKLDVGRIRIKVENSSNNSIRQILVQ